MANDVMIKIQGDISGLQKELQSVKKELGNLGKDTKSAFSGITGVLGKIGGVVATAFAVDKIKDFGMYALQSASDVEEMENKFNVVFSSIGKDVDKWASDFGKAIGRTKTEIKTGVANLGDLLTGYGMTEKASADLSQKVIELSYDLASFNNVQDADAIDRMTKGILGEHEGLKALGISLNETNLQNKMMEMGLSGQFAKLDEVTKAQVRWAVMLDQTKNAQGDAKRSADSYANSVKTLKANIQEAVEGFGKQLLPIATEIVQALIPVANALIPIATTLGGALADAVVGSIKLFKEFGQKVQEVGKWMSEHKLEVTALALVLGTLATAIGITLIKMNSFTIMCKVMSIKNKLLATSMGLVKKAVSGLKLIGTVLKGALNPYTLGIMGAIAVGYLMIKNWDTIKETAIKVWNYVGQWLSQKMSEISQNITEIWSGVCDFFKGVWNGICNVVSFGVQFLGMIIQGAMVSIQAVWGVIWQLIGDKVMSVFNTIKNAVSTALSFVWSIISNYLNMVWNFWSNVFTTLSTIVSTVFTSIGNFISNIMSAIWNVISSIWTSISNFVSTVVNTIKTNVSDAFTRVKDAINTKITEAKNKVTEVFNNIKSTISDKVEQARQKVKDTFEKVKEALWKPVEDAKNKISGIFDKIKSIFNTVLKPNIKIPKISLTGKFSLNPPSVPKFSLDWYQTGGIFTGASVIGVGENGDEAVVPLSNKSRMKPFAQAVAKMMPDSGVGNASGGTGGDINIHVAQLVVREDADIQRIAKELKVLQDRENRKNGRR